MPTIVHNSTTQHVHASAHTLPFMPTVVNRGPRHGLSLRTTSSYTLIRRGTHACTHPRSPCSYTHTRPLPLKHEVPHAHVYTLKHSKTNTRTRTHNYPHLPVYLSSVCTTNPIQHTLFFLCPSSISRARLPPPRIASSDSIVITVLKRGRSRSDQDPNSRSNR